MSAVIFDPLVLPEEWFSPSSSISPQSWFDQQLADNTSYTAVLAVTLGAVSLGATAQAGVSASLSVTLGAVSLSSTAIAEVHDSLTVTLGAVSVQSAVVAEVLGTAQITLGPVVASSTTVSEVHASVQATLDPVTLVSASVADVVGGAFITLDAVTSSSTLAVAVQGGLGATLGPATLFSEVVTSFTTPRFVNADILLGPVTTSAHSTVQVSASLNATLGAVTLVSSIARHRLGFGASPKRTVLTVKDNDDEPPLVWQILDVLGSHVDLTLAQSVAFRMALTLDRIEIFSRPAVVDDAASGVVSYTWQPGDLVPGVYYGEFVVTWPGDRDQTYPQSGYLVVVVEPKV